MSTGSDCDAPPAVEATPRDSNSFTVDDSDCSCLQVSKRRKATPRRVVCVPVADGKRKGEGPPSDAWAWRKYGQKPIKGSPYPRGYYRCSSCKGCPARKQVERSRSDPSMLVITYAFSHTHSFGESGADPSTQYEQRVCTISAMKMEEEDLFADLGELKESSSAINGRGSFLQ